MMMEPLLRRKYQVNQDFAKLCPLDLELELELEFEGEGEKISEKEKASPYRG